MKRRSGVLIAILGLILGMGLTPAVTAPAEAAARAYCNIYPPSRIAKWKSLQIVSVAVGAGCLESGIYGAGWMLVQPHGSGAGGTGWGPPTLTTTFEMYNDFPLTTITFVPDGGFGPAPIYGDVDQNTAKTVVKLGAVAYISAKRSGSYHVVTARTYNYNPKVEKIAPTSGRVGQVQFRKPGTKTWRPVANVKTASNGHAVIRTWSPGAREYRVVFGEKKIIWAATSATIRAK